MLQIVFCRAKKGWNFIEQCWQTHEFINLIQTSLNLISTDRKRKQTDKKLLSFNIYDVIVPNIEFGSLQQRRQLLLGSGTHSWLGAIHEPQGFLFNLNLVVWLLTQAIWSDLWAWFKSWTLAWQKGVLTFCEHSKEQFPGVLLYFYENSLTLLCVVEFLNKISISMATNHKSKKKHSMILFWSLSSSAFVIQMRFVIKNMKMVLAENIQK